MPVRTHTCLTVVCDVCKAPLQDDQDCTMHLADLAEARSVARALQWSSLSGGEFVCNLGDDDHQAFLDALMPPEPAVHFPGQLGFDGGEKPA
ncbi:hypothetical protein [Streptomyces ossamyceticus]|uniref:hypothetical protein n=1 Tax=Streptomyces ossamyceticus TaxID=249581 RepID=UPI0034472BC4